MKLSLRLGKGGRVGFLFTYPDSIEMLFVAGIAENMVVLNHYKSHNSAKVNEPCRVCIEILSPIALLAV